MSSPTFLTGPAIQIEVARLMKASELRVAAVAFWGINGTDQSGISERAAGQIRILCDLFSGACNPKEVQRLINAGAEVKTLDGMHAKVWCAGDRAIVGSANASSSGLGLEAGKRATNEEAAVFIEDAAFAEGVRTWFAKLWDSNEAIAVGRDEVADATPAWEKNQKGAARQTTRTVGGLLASTRAKSPLSRVRVFAYSDTEPSTEAKQAFERVRLVYPKTDLDLYGELLPFYEDPEGSWGVERGDIVIDFTCAPGGARLKFGGLWRVRTDLPYHLFKRPGFPKARLVLLDRIFHINGFRLPKDEQTKLAAIVRAKMKGRGPDTFEGTCLDTPLLDLWPGGSA